ncbi:transferase [Syncephalis fuscata]|nr:transferase [Syncephalis fuscata]
MSRHLPVQLIKPDTSLPEQAIRLNDVDLFQPSVHIKPTFLYHDLIKGLRLTLNQFSIYYGRLGKTEDNRIEIRPSDEGIRLYETHITTDFDKLGPHWRYADIPLDFDTEPLAAERGDPLCVVKITRFANNSGVAIATLQHHLIVDIASANQFVRVWADYVRGDSPPTFESNRSLLKSRLTNTGALSFPTGLSITSLLKPQKTAILYATADNLAKLKADVQADIPTDQKDSVPWISTLDALNALLIRAQLRVESSSDIRVLTIPLNLRSRLPDKIPLNYFGNATLPIMMKITVKDILSQSIGYLAAMIRREINKIDENYIDELLVKAANLHTEWPTLDFILKRFCELDLCLTDWSKSDLYSADFGHGKPIRFRCAGAIYGPPVCNIGVPPSDTSSTIDGTELYASVPADSFELFAQDEELCKYLTLHG